MPNSTQLVLPCIRPCYHHHPFEFQLSTPIWLSIITTHLNSNCHHLFEFQLSLSIWILIVTNLIKCMVDTWNLKRRWQLEFTCGVTVGIQKWSDIWNSKPSDNWNPKGRFKLWHGNNNKILSHNQNHKSSILPFASYSGDPLCVGSAWYSDAEA